MHFIDQLPWQANLFHFILFLPFALWKAAQQWLFRPWQWVFGVSAYRKIGDLFLVNGNICIYIIFFPLNCSLHSMVQIDSQIQCLNFSYIRYGLDVWIKKAEEMKRTNLGRIIYNSIQSNSISYIEISKNPS